MFPAFVTVKGNCTVCPGIAVSAERLSANIKFGTCFTKMFKPPVEEADDPVDGVLSTVLVLTGDGVATGMLGAVLLFVAVRTGCVVAAREFVFASPCDPVVVVGVALRSRPVFDGCLLLFVALVPTLAAAEFVFIN